MQKRLRLKSVLDETRITQTAIADFLNVRQNTVHYWAKKDKDLFLVFDVLGKNKDMRLDKSDNLQTVYRGNVVKLVDWYE